MDAGTAIKRLLKKEGISTYRLAQLTGLSETYLSKMLRNQYAPTWRTVERILRVLGYKIVFQKK